MLSLGKNVSSVLRALCSILQEQKNESTNRELSVYVPAKITTRPTMAQMAPMTPLLRLKLADESPSAPASLSTSLDAVAFDGNAVPVWDDCCCCSVGADFLVETMVDCD